MYDNIYVKLWINRKRFEKTQYVGKIIFIFLIYLQTRDYNIKDKIV